MFNINIILSYMWSVVGRNKGADKIFVRNGFLVKVSGEL